MEALASAVDVYRDIATTGSLAPFTGREVYPGPGSSDHRPT